MSNRVQPSELRAFVERYERLELDKQDISDAQKELMSELKSRGYDAKPFKAIIAARKKDPEQRAEEEAIFDMYAEAIGL